MKILKNMHNFPAFSFFNLYLCIVHAKKKSAREIAHPLYPKSAQSIKLLFKIDAEAT